MWADFFTGFLILGLFLTLPGFLFAKTLGCRTLDGLCLSSVISICFYELLSVLYGEFGIHSRWQIYFFPAIVFSLTCFLSRFYFSKTRKKTCKFQDSVYTKSKTTDFYSRVLRKPKNKRSWIFASWLACGLFFTGVVVLANLGTPNVFSSVYDNYFHVNLPSVYLESGNWSTLHTSVYVSDSNCATPMLPSGRYSYYPAAQHMLVAMISGALSLPITIGINIVNCYFISIILSSSMFLLSMTICKNKLPALALGSVATYAFASFPYLAYITNYSPFLCSVCLVPSALAVFIRGIDASFTHARKYFFTNLVLFIFCFATIGFLHPSSVFGLLIIIAFFSIHKILCRQSMKPTLKTLMIIGIVALLASIFILFINLPMGQSMALHINNTPIPVGTSALLVFSFAFLGGQPQFLLGATVTIGLLCSILRKKYRWLAATYIVFVAIYIVAASFENGTFIKTLLTACWYGKPDRISFMLVVLAIPLLTLGLYAVVSFAKWAINSLFHRKVSACILCSIIAVPFLIMPLMPYLETGDLESSSTPFGYAEATIKGTYQGTSDADTDIHVYNPREQAFVEKAQEITGDNAVIANVPSDGSFLAYGVSGLNTYTRTFGGALTKDAWDIVSLLNQYTQNETVANAAKAAGIRYVIQLDAGRYNEPDAQIFNSHKFLGVANIDEQTDGFELVLSEDDMKLYKLTEL